MFKLLACFLAIQLTLQTCDKGCLRCANLSASSTEKVCVLCDLAARYYLKGKACEVSSATNCDIINPIDGNCASCSQDYYLDSTTKKCIAVATDKKVTDCVEYDSSSNCTTCKSGKFLSQGACVAVTTSIANCDTYSTGALCAECADEYYLGSESKTCVIIPSTSNCTSFSKFECKACATTHILNHNLYFTNRYKTSTTSELQTLYSYVILNKANIRLQDDSVAVCQKTTVDFCLEFTDFKTCKTCIDGYYLNQTNTCTVYPFDQILNCSVYQSEVICDQCEQGSLLKSNTSCTTIVDSEKKTGCKTYRTDTSTAQCTECNSTHYLSGTSCVERTKTAVTGCASYSPNADKCLTCNTSQVLSSDGLLCLNMPSQCMTVQSFTSTATQDSLVCSKCNNGYYKDSNGACVTGSVQSCGVYQTSADACVTCVNKFFLQNNNTCFAHADIASCNLYSNSVQNQCETCSTDYHNLIVNKYCATRTEISNCLTYSFNNAVSTCDVCKDGFKKVNNACDPIGIDQCKTFNTACTNCNSGFGLAVKAHNNNTEPGCIAGHSYVTTNCTATMITDSTTDFNGIGCSACAANAFPYRDDTSHVCVNENRRAQLPTPFTNLITNCLQYSSDGNCKYCAQGKYLKADKTECLDTCGSTYQAFQVDINATIVTASNNNLCLTDVANNQIHAPMINDDLDASPIKCKNWVTVVDDFGGTNSSIYYTNVNPNPQSNHAWVEHPLDVFNAIQCPAHANTDQIDGVVKTTAVTGRECDLYYDFDAKNYGCVKCPWGKVGSSSTFVVPVAGESSLGICETMNTCETNTKYKNINPYWNQFFSCHKCSSSVSIPVLIAKMADVNSPEVTGFVKVNNDKTIPAKTDPGAGYNAPLICLDMSTELTIANGLGIADAQGTSTTVDKLAGCAIAVFNPVYTTANFDNKSAYTNTAGDFPTDTKSALFCASCKPGFKAAYFDNKKNIARYCTAIANCQTGGSWFNACEQCATGYKHKYDDTNGINYDECVAIPASNTGLNNCLAYKQTTDGQTPGVCKVCAKGYYLNEDNYCEQITVPNCESGRFADKAADLSKEINPQYNLWVYQNGYGCSKCTSGYFSYPAANLTIKTYCVISDYVFSTKTTYPNQAITTATVSNFIANCKYYNNDATDVVCNTCNDNFVIRDDGSECLSANTVSNCTTAKNTGNQCLVCKDGYALLTGGTCSLGTIANCMTYYTSTEKSEQQCQICNDGFFLETGSKKCSQGYVSGCKRYVDFNEYKCVTCEDTYYLVTGQHYCLKKIAALNCKSADFSSTTITCQVSSCNNSWEELIDNTLNADVTLNASIAKSRCFEINKVANCETHTTTFSTASNTYSFTCSACKDGFYLQKNGYLCTARTVKPTNCKTYNPSEDKCSVCNAGYYLKVVDGKTTCLANPTGVIKCRTYKFDAANGLSCVACKADFYLLAGLCPAVPADKKIVNCQYYSNETTCSSCISTHFLKANLCVQITALNCAKLINESSCEICNSGFRLVTENGLNKCESFTKPNCASYEQTGSNNCLICNKNFYPDATGSCVAVSPIIANCERNSSNTQCVLCSSSYGLSSDGTKCVEKGIFDANCTQQTMPTNMKCNVCSAGHYFKDGTCTAFSQNGVSTGCFTVNPSDETVCLVCRIDYYMKSDLKCYEMNPATTPEGSFSFVLQIISLVFFAIYAQ